MVYTLVTNKDLTSVELDSRKVLTNEKLYWLTKIGKVEIKSDNYKEASTLRKGAETALRQAGFVADI